MTKTRKSVRIVLSALVVNGGSLSVLHLLGGTLRLRYKGWVRLKSTRELKQLSCTSPRELAACKTLAEYTLR